MSNKAKYQLLDWDSKFFGFKVANISFSETDVIELDKLLGLLKQKDVTLVYFSSIINIDFMHDLLRKYCGSMLDKKITYLKRVHENLNNTENIVNYELRYPTEKMLKLAVESGIYSRFNCDKRIGKSKYEELYKLWITNSVNHLIAKDVLVYVKDEDIKGMVTLSEKNKRANVGIIAVGSNSRGKGIGMNLMETAINWAIENAYDEIQVVTQENNIPACKLYEKCGFSRKKIEYFYHFWLKNEY